jgi:hypothetical protein
MRSPVFDHHKNLSLNPTHSSFMYLTLKDFHILVKYIFLQKVFNLLTLPYLQISHVNITIYTDLGCILSLKCTQNVHKCTVH